MGANNAKRTLIHLVGQNLDSVEMQSTSRVMRQRPSTMRGAPCKTTLLQVFSQPVYKFLHLLVATIRLRAHRNLRGQVVEASYRCCRARAVWIGSC